MHPRTLIASLSLGVSLSLASVSFAQMESGGGKNAKQKDEQAQPRSGGDNVDPGLLAGPTVEQEAEEGRNNPMTSPNNVNRQRAGNAQNVPFRQWMETIRGLDLSDEQRQRVFAIVGEFQAESTAYQQKHGEEMRRLQQQARTAREGGKDVDPTIREQLQKLEATSPKQTDAQRNVWNVLTAEQQEKARVKLAEIDARRSEGRRAGGAIAAGGNGQSANPARPAGGRNNDTPDQGGGGEGMTPSGSGNRNKRGTMEPGGDDPMTPAAGGGMTDTPMTEPAPAAAKPERATPVRERAINRTAPGTVDLGQLDQQARKRLRFLMSKQTAARAGNAPTAGEKSFKFVEDDDS